MNDKEIRISGSALLIAGITMAYYGAFLPLEAAAIHATDTGLSLRLTFLAPLAAGFGGFGVLFGQRGREWMFADSNIYKRMKPAGWVFTLICFVASFTFFEWVRSRFLDLGYLV